MERIVSRLENNSAVAAVCYVLPLLAAPYFVLSFRLAAGFVAVLALVGMLAARDSRLRFHSFQAGLVLVAVHLMMGLAYWIMIGANKDNLALNGGIAIMITLGMVAIVWGVIVLVFGLAYLYVAVKAAAGKDVYLPGVGNMAVWLARDLPGVATDALKGFKGTLAQIARGEYRLKDHLPELGAVAAIVVLIGLLAFAVPGIFTLSPQPAPPQGIKALALTSTESFVGFPWDIDVERTKKIAGEQGWRTGDHVSAMTGLGCRAVLEGYPALLQFFYVSDQGYSRHLYQGFISMRENNCPVEALYQRFREMLTEKYGPAAELDYPPWRSPGTPPYGPGYGSRWEITDENGQKIKIYLALEFEKTGYSSAPARPATLHVRYENQTVYEKALKKSR